MLTDDQWLGYADVLRKVDAPGALGAWLYEVQDTKLSRETRGGTILQLGVYSELLGRIQGRTPEFFHVVTPLASEAYSSTTSARSTGRSSRASSISSRQARRAIRPNRIPTDRSLRRVPLVVALQRAAPQGRSPVVRRQPRPESSSRAVEPGRDNVGGVGGVADSLPFTPTRGSLRHSSDSASRRAFRQRSGHPARRRSRSCRSMPTWSDAVPEPRPGDLFLDLEGDPFGRPVVGPRPGEGGREYLFGLGRVEPDGRSLHGALGLYGCGGARGLRGRDRADHDGARAGSRRFTSTTTRRTSRATFKRLMGRYASSEIGSRQAASRPSALWTLFAIARSASAPASKATRSRSLEPFYEFTRDVALRGGRRPAANRGNCARDQRSRARDAVESVRPSRGTTRTIAGRRPSCATGSNRCALANRAWRRHPRPPLQRDQPRRTSGNGSSE